MSWWVFRKKKGGGGGGFERMARTRRGDEQALEKY